VTAERDIEFGRLAIERGFVEQAVVRACYGARGSQSLRDALLAQGALTLEQVRELDTAVETAPPPVGGGASEVATSIPRVGAVLGDHEVTGVLGHGAMGAVLRGKDRRTGEAVAIKVLLPNEVTKESIDRFRHEVAAMARVERSANVVHLLASGTLEGTGLPYAVMDFIVGHDLSCELDGGAPLPLERALGLGVQVARAVHACHVAGILHRDLKPANILVREPDGRAFVADFGVARVSEMTQLTVSGQTIGTPLYMSPEQSMGKIHAQDERTDVYSLGAVLYHALTGEPPFVAATAVELYRMIESVPATDPRTERPEIPPAVGQIVLKCLAKDPADRYSTALDLALDLERALAGATVSARAVSMLVLRLRSLRRHAAAIAALGVVVAITAGAGVVVLGRESFRKKTIAELLEQARKPGVTSAELAAIKAQLSGPSLHAPSEVAAVASLERSVTAREVAEAMRDPAKRIPAALEQAVAAAAEAPGAACLVGEGGGFSLGDAILERRERALDEGTAASAHTADELLALARRLAAMGGESSAARALRAYERLAAANAPVRALGPGGLDFPDGLLERVVPDLEAATSLAGEPGDRAAWLLVDLLECGGSSDDGRAREALARAIARKPDDPARASLERVLQSEVSAAALATWTRELGPSPKVDALRGLARFLAHAGLPETLDAPELAAEPTCAGLIAALARDRAGAFAVVPSPPLSAETERQLAPLKQTAVEELDPLHPRAEPSDAGLAQKLHASDAAHWPRAAEAIARGLALAPLDETFLRASGDTARWRTSRVAFDLVAERSHESSAQELSESFCAEDRRASRAGWTSDYWPEEVFEFDGSPEEVCRKFDERLDRDFAADEHDLLEGNQDERLRRLLALAVRAAKGLERVEVLSEAEVPEGAARDRLVWEALAGLHDLGQIGGPLVLVLRAPLRRIAFPGRTGEALAMLDLARACKAPEGDSEGDGFHFLLFALARTQSPQPIPALCDPIRESLRRAAIEWAHRLAVATARRRSEGKRPSRAVAHDKLGSLLDQLPRSWHAVAGVEGLLGSPSLELTPVDAERLGGATDVPGTSTPRLWESSR
jgi:hypothetical protein